MSRRKSRPNAGSTHAAAAAVASDGPLPLVERVLHAASVLRGRSAAVTPAQLLAWRLELFQLRSEWNSTQETLNAWAARVAQRERRALDSLQEPQPQDPQTDAFDKNALRKHVFGG